MQTGVNVWCDVKGEGWLVAGGRSGYLVVVVPSVVLLEEAGDRRLRLQQQDTITWAWKQATLGVTMGANACRLRVQKGWFGGLQTQCRTVGKISTRKEPPPLGSSSSSPPIRNLAGALSGFSIPIVIVRALMEPLIAPPCRAGGSRWWKYVGSRRWMVGSGMVIFGTAAAIEAKRSPTVGPGGAFSCSSWGVGMGMGWGSSVVLQGNAKPGALVLGASTGI